MTPPPAEQLASRLFAGPALRAQPDRRLVKLVREGYEVAFEEIVRRYGRSLGRYAAAIVGGRSEDVTQDAFSKALLALRRDGAEIELRPWLYRIVRNTALNDLRDRPPAAEALAETVAGGRGPSEEVEQREELAELMRRLRALPEPQRAAIVMRELEGLGHEEIAAALGLSGGGARQAIYRARQALRDGLGMLLPLPLLKSMLAAGAAGPFETATGAAGAAGAGLALKATDATVLVASAVGAGVALHGGREVAGAAAGGGGARNLARDVEPPAGATEQRPSSRSGDGGGGRGKGQPGSDRAGRGNGSGLQDGHRSGGGSSGQGGGGSGGGDHHSGASLTPSSGRDGGGSGGGSGSGDSTPGGGSTEPSGDSSGAGEQPSSGDGGSSGTSGGGGSDGGSGSGGGSEPEVNSGSLDPSGSSNLSGPYEERPADG